MATNDKSDALAVKVKTVRDLFENRKGEFNAALPKHMDVDRMIRIAVTSIRKNPKLAEADPASLYGAVMEAAQCGLYLDGVLGEASLLPFWNTKKKCYEVVFIPGYRGLVKLAHRSGKVRDVSAHIVYKGETFSYSEGEQTTLKHVPRPPADREEERIGAYSRVIFNDGSISINFMWADEIIAIRDNTPAVRKKTATPWLSDIEFEQNEMWKKTVFRNHSKWLNLSPELTTAAVLDEMHDAGVSQRNLGPDEEVYTDAPVITMPEPVSEEDEVVDAESTENADLTLDGGETEAFALEVSIRESGEVLGKKAGDITKDIKDCKGDVEALQKLDSTYKDELK